MKTFGIGALLIFVLAMLLFFVSGCAGAQVSESEPYKITLTDQLGVDHFAVTPSAWKIPQDIQFLQYRAMVFGGIACLRGDFLMNEKVYYFGVFACPYTPRIVALEFGALTPEGGIIDSSRKWCVYDNYDGQNPRIVSGVELNKFINVFLGTKPEPKTRV
jgi:hypothetical protein